MIIKFENMDSIKNNICIFYSFFTIKEAIFIYKIMKKIWIHICALFILCGYWSLYAGDIPEKPEIISREEWWADESYTDRNSSYWQEIIAKRNDFQSSNQGTNLTPAQLKAQQDSKKAIDYVNENFSDHFDIDEKIYSYNGDTQAWPLQYMDTVDALVIHHTDSEYTDSQTGIQDIYKYHSLSRQWGDIGYNYIIWYDWKIYEGRKWWDYVSAAHSKWNNYSTMWIALMWNYSNKWLSSEQYAALKQLVSYLSYHYGIDLNARYYYNMDCAGTACQSFPLETTMYTRLVWHRDTGHTSCPWDQLYAQIQQLREELRQETAWYLPVPRWMIAQGIKKSDTLGETNLKILQVSNMLSKYPQEALEHGLKIINEKQSQNITQSQKETLNNLEFILEYILKTKYKTT